jgi:Flp pilus assembly protein TadD
MAKKTGTKTIPETSPVDPDVIEVNVDDLIKEARKSVQKGRYRDAIRMLETATETVPEHTEAWNNLGVANLLVGELDQAELAFRSGLEQDPENPQMIKNLIQTLLQIPDKFVEGMDMLVKFLELRPTDPDAIYMLGRCLQANGDLHKAAALYGRVLQLDHTYTLAKDALKEIAPVEPDLSGQ